MRLPCSVSVPNVARQRFGKHVSALSNDHATIVIVFDMLISLLCMSHQRKVDD
jgi:hypothetical protein